MNLEVLFDSYFPTAAHVNSFERELSDVASEIGSIQKMVELHQSLSSVKAMSSRSEIANWPINLLQRIAHLSHPQQPHHFVQILVTSA